MTEAVRQRTRAMKIKDRRTQEMILTVSVSGGVATMQHGDDAQSFGDPRAVNPAGGDPKRGASG